MIQVDTIDCQYQYEKYAASYLLTHGGRAAFIEANTSHAVPHLLAALRARGLSPAAVDWVIVTHAHLDHAAGASALLAECTNAKLVAHPKAARHLIDPTRLTASAKKVYGDEKFDRLYGRLDPIDKDRVWIVADGESLHWQGEEFRFLFTLGHASHHLCVHQVGDKSIYTGDSFGVGFPIVRDTPLYIFPSTSPTDFDPAAAIETVRRIASIGLERAYLTHFGAISNLPAAAALLERELRFASDLLENIRPKVASAAEDTRRFCQQAIEARFAGALGERWKDPRVRAVLATDIDVNAQGIVHAAQRGAKLPA